MKIKISNLANGEYEYEFEEDITEVEISEPYLGKLKTKVLLTKFDDQILLSAETGIKASLECDRCNTDYTKVIESKYKVVYFLRYNEFEDESADVYYIHPDTDSIDISKDVRDIAILSIPMKKLCKDDCKGLCINCGKNLNEGNCGCDTKQNDLRWQPLMDLKNKQNTN
jgi:uncharacterized protein